MSTSSDQNVVLTPEQFADKLQIGRSTLFNWLAQDILLEGEHYFRVGRVIRFLWNSSILLEVSGTKRIKRQQHIRPSKHKKKNPVNWDY